MRLLTTLFVAALVFSTTALAQSTSPLPNDPGAVVLGTFTVNTAILNGGTGSNGQPLARAKAKPATGDVIAEITFMRTSSGKINYMIKSETIELIGGAKDWSTRGIYNHLADAAVVHGTNAGITSCSTGCSSTVTTVWAHSCVERNGNQFTVVNSSLVSSRDYTVCCDSNGALVTMVSINDPGCTGQIQ
jgi:hypothetical protein